MFKICVLFKKKKMYYSSIISVTSQQQRSACRGESPTPAPPSCPWPAATSQTLEAPAASCSLTCPCALSNYLTSPCTGTTSAASSRETSLSNPWWWLWSTPVGGAEKLNGISSKKLDGLRTVRLSGLLLVHLGTVVICTSLCSLILTWNPTLHNNTKSLHFK